MKFQRFGVVGVSSPDERTLGGKSSENLFLITGVSDAEDDECLLTGMAIVLLLVSAEGVLISPSSVNNNK